MIDDSSTAFVEDNPDWIIATRPWRAKGETWLQWTLATSLGVAVGILIAAITNPCWMSWLVVGICQWVSLRRQLEIAGWLAAGTVTFATITGVLTGNIRLGWYVATVGTIVGLAQWLVLRRRFDNAGLWITISTLSWVAGSFLVLLMMDEGTSFEELSRLVSLSEETGAIEPAIAAIEATIDRVRVFQIVIGGGGLVAGLCTWLVLRGRTKRASLLPIFQAVGWLASITIATTMTSKLAGSLLEGTTNGGQELQAETISLVGSLAFGLLGMGVIPGIATGLGFALSISPRDVELWFENARQFTAAHPLSLSISTDADLRRLIAVVTEQFAHFVREKGGWRLLWNDSGHPRDERVAQTLFLLTLEQYCQANDIDISRESETGRGPVDFKVSQGYSRRAIIEVKLARSSALWTGVEKQVPAYMNADGISVGHILVIKLTEDDNRRLERIPLKINELRTIVDYELSFNVVDASYGGPPSASRL